MVLKSGYPLRAEELGVVPKQLVMPWRRRQKKSVRRLVAESDYRVAD